MTSLAPSLSLAAAADRLWDAVVIGAGPAGSLAACLLARKGHQVLLLDRSPFPRDKVCGCCLNPAGARLLQELNLGSIVAGAARLDRFLLRLPRRTLDLALPPSFALPRAVLDARLVRAAMDAGSQFLPSTIAHLCASDDSAPFRVVEVHSGGAAVAIRTRVVLAADGLRGTTLDACPQCAWRIAENSWFGICCTLAHPLPGFPANTITMHAALDGYIGVIRLPEGQTHLAAALDPAECKRAGHPAELLANILHACHSPIPPGLHHASLLASPFLTRRRPCLGAHRVLAIGDAAAYVEPFTGEGMTWAMQSAHLVAQCLPASLDCWPAELPLQWTALHRRFLAGHYRTCRVMRFALHHPPLLASAAFVSRLVPPLARLLARRVSSPPSSIRPAFAGVMS